MKAVVDANVVFSALISGSDIYIRFIKANEIYAPDFIFQEVERYEKRIIKKTNLEEAEFRKFVYILFKNIKTIPKFGISRDSWQRAYKLCKDLDEKDTPYVALSIELDIDLITRDKKLIEGLRNKEFKRILDIEEILKL